MWKSIFEVMRQILNMTEKTQKNTTDIKELREELKNFSAETQAELQNLRSAIERLAFEIQRLSERERHEREKLILRLENRLLRYERGLPPTISDSEEQ